MTTVYLAWQTIGHRTLAEHTDQPVNLLVAYPLLAAFMKRRAAYNIGRWVLDSGAFSVFSGRTTIDLADFIARAKDTDADEVFGLDVIGDRDATRRNLEATWAAGLMATPTLHPGATEADARWAKQAPKVALGGVARMRGGKKLSFLRWGAAALWPHRIHVFGCTDQETLKIAPWHSVDSSSWEMGPTALGRWSGFTGKSIKMVSRGVRDFWLEVLEMKRREREAAFRWRRELARLEAA